MPRPKKLSEKKHKEENQADEDQAQDEEITEPFDYHQLLVSVGALVAIVGIVFLFTTALNPIKTQVGRATLPVQEVSGICAGVDVSNADIDCYENGDTCTDNDQCCFTHQCISKEN